MKLSKLHEEVRVVLQVIVKKGRFDWYLCHTVGNYYSKAPSLWPYWKEFCVQVLNKRDGVSGNWKAYVTDSELFGHTSIHVSAPFIHEYATDMMGLHYDERTPFVVKSREEFVTWLINNY